MDRVQLIRGGLITLNDVPGSPDWNYATMQALRLPGLLPMEDPITAFIRCTHTGQSPTVHLGRITAPDQELNLQGGLCAGLPRLVSAEAEKGTRIELYAARLRPLPTRGTRTLVPRVLALEFAAAYPLAQLAIELEYCLGHAIVPGGAITLARWAPGSPGPPLTEGADVLPMGPCTLGLTSQARRLHLELSGTAEGFLAALTGARCVWTLGDGGHTVTRAVHTPLARADAFGVPNATTIDIDVPPSATGLYRIALEGLVPQSAAQATLWLEELP